MRDKYIDRQRNGEIERMKTRAWKYIKREKGKDCQTHRDRERRRIIKEREREIERECL